MFVAIPPSVVLTRASVCIVPEMLVTPGERAVNWMSARWREDPLT